MQHQLDLDFTGITDTKFKEYHQSNPEIYEAFKEYAIKAIQKEHRNLSAEYIFNIIRWSSPVYAKTDQYKINNNYKPFYARLFMNQYPSYKGFFRTRKSKADKVNEEI